MHLNKILDCLFLLLQIFYCFFDYLDRVYWKIVLLPFCIVLLPFCIVLLPFCIVLLPFCIVSWNDSNQLYTSLFNDYAQCWIISLLDNSTISLSYRSQIQVNCPENISLSLPALQVQNKPWCFTHRPHWR